MPAFPFGDGTIGLPGHHGIDTDLGGGINGLFVMPVLRQSLHKSQSGDRPFFFDELSNLGYTVIRVVEHDAEPQPPAIGKLKLITLLQAHGLHGMASNLSRQGKLPADARFVGVHRHIIVIGIKQKYSIRHAF